MGESGREGPERDVWGDLPAGHPLSDGEVEARARELRDRLTLAEKIAMLSGDAPLVRGALSMARRYNPTPIVAGAVPRLGIPGIRFTDGPRGVVMGNSTAFPVPMARGATFDPDLETRIGDAIGVEARSQGANLFAGVCVNLLRHPAWGRAQETYGEDPHLLGEMGAALVRGAQRHVMACVKHYACNSMENARFRVDVRIDDTTLRDVYLPHFRRCVDAGAASVMSAYNRVNGQWCGHHGPLLQGILKDEWGFDGFVMSDFVFGVRDAAAALIGGQDLEMPFCFRFRRLLARVAAGQVPGARIDDAVLRLLRAQVRHAQVGEAGRYGPETVACAAHRALAREAATKAMVLLRNEVVAGAGAPVLPLDPGRHRRVAVVGRLADLPNTGDRGSSWVRAPHVVTVLEGLRAAAGTRGVEVVAAPVDDPSVAERVAAGADAAVVVVGCTHRDEGEYIWRSGGDRAHLTLRPAHEALVRTVAARCPETVVVIEGASAFVTESWRERVPAVLVAWYPGMEGGHAVADVLFGAAAPGGRLPCTWARAAADYPPFDRRARAVTYGPLHGYRLMLAEERDPAFWFGSGLGYTTFAYGPATVQPTAVGSEVRVEIRNTGSRPGDEVVQVYADRALGSEHRPLPALCGFRRVTVTTGATATVRIPVPEGVLADAGLGPARLTVGPSADPTARQEVCRLTTHE